MNSKHFLRIAFRGLPVQLVPVDFADDASRIFCDVRDRNGFASSDMKPGCGDLLDASKKIVGRISYNGRIWPAETETAGALTS